MPDELDPRQIIELLEAYLLGSAPTYTSLEIAENSGVPIEVARARWRSLGFTSVPEDEVAFTEADLEAMRLTQRMHDLGLVEDDDESALIRTLGRSYARLAEWQLGLLARTLDVETTDLEELGTVITEVTPVIEQVQNYVWRRHVLSAASRLLLAPAAGDEGPATAIGFADIVGYTRQSRSLRGEELALLVEEFEARTLEIVTLHGGRIIKTIGDEVLFAADAPREAALIGLELVESHLADEGFPELRVGIAWGPVLNRLGDVFGPTVNVASRLTSTARPGRVLVDRALAEALEGSDSPQGASEFKLRRMRRTSVKGYRRLEPWSLRRSGASESAEQLAE